jgi:hypothetical protein
MKENPTLRTVGLSENADVEFAFVDVGRVQ